MTRSLSIVVRTFFVLGALAGFPPAAVAGSVYDPAAYDSLASDLVAARVGDTLTVIVYESSVAEASAFSATGRGVELGAEGSGEISGVGGGSANASIGADSDFVGDGEINRSGSLVARVSVLVEQVMDNGELVVKGRQDLVFNEETQVLEVRGRVRPVDIERDNTVLSTRLSDATIEYTGDGILADTTRKSWWNRLFEWVF